ncbi:hypothetical protein CspeluHIS016_0101440 [Cutaneotrichosporon spelunceum]|uniref:Cyclase n=1 Tax=Cutaneotrichosporon spelunceum TaxID=1672016 RepID=A0AAD3Y8Z9_9TREE|nr:hypothetical protein CspeluHIS016_0101440 [Cutaneotrichosporon spelunceum]
MTISLPTFDELKARDPKFNAWHAYPNEELGRLNLITPESIKRGRDAIKHGIAVNLNLPLSTFPSLSPAVRPMVEHEVVFRGHCLDDRVSFNTQCSTQWDGFNHYPYRNYPTEGEYTYYGGQPTAVAMDKSIKKYGIQNYAEHPITGRAHLLDIPRHLAATGQAPLPPLQRSVITLAMLQETAAAQGCTFAEGDILLVRTGLTEAMTSLSEPEYRATLAAARGWIGVEATEDLWRWHWENGLAAVATDTFAYEAYPLPGPGLSCHEVFLAGWGMPIGELFDLRRLAALCAEKGQWTFFFASMVLNLDGGVASPPNAQAIL